MNKVLATAALAILIPLTGVAPAFAQDYGPPRPYDRDQDRGPRDHEPNDRRPDDRRADDRGPRDDRRNWQRGDRYEGTRYVVDDYRRYDLPPPPDDRHRWVRDRNGDFVLIAVATGLITDILLHGGR